MTPASAARAIAFQGLSCAKSSVDSETARYRSCTTFRASASLSLIEVTLAPTPEVVSSPRTAADDASDVFGCLASSLASLRPAPVDCVAVVARAASRSLADEVEGLNELML